MNQLPQVVRINDVARALHCTRATVANMVKRNELPAPRRIGRSHPYWLASDIAYVIGGTVPDVPKQAA